ncbi:hypothetical protein IEQ34_015495 [Dendrobium chrysotoxum]|uniref:Uncharacterized protein n=1 Tax=Dendrobium chrysotoxum TaxID=161865 RepID=A0AAV7GJ56_DENCH|nr:hypothetical protein IEQ34_015495 [Dendrobium chrysotoxum]
MSADSLQPTSRRQRLTLHQSRRTRRHPMLHHLLWATQLMTRLLTPNKFTLILRIVATVFGKDVVLPCAVAVCWRHASEREENLLMNLVSISLTILLY